MKCSLIWCLCIFADQAFASGGNSAELVAFVPPRPGILRYLTGSGVPLVDPQIKLPIYFHNPPPRPYEVLGYVKVSNQPEGNQPRKRALQSAAWCGLRHGGEALYLVEPSLGEYMIAAVLKWKR